MRKIKIFQRPSQQDIDKWVEEETPTIISIDSSPGAKYEEYSRLYVLYDEKESIEL